MPIIDFVISFFLLLIGWWLPALVYYAGGIFLLSTWRRRPWLAVLWLASFLALFGYSAYEGVFLKGQLERRAESYRQHVKYTDLPDDITTIVLTRSQEDDLLTGRPQSCSFVCANLLLSGRFKTVIIAVKDHRLFSDNRPLKRSFPPESYDVFTIVDEPGCQSHNIPSLFEVFEAWRLLGRCLHKKTVKQIEGRHLEVTTNEDVPDQPPWRLRFTTHVRIVDAGRFTDIARVEHANVRLAYWFPVPGVFLRARSSVSSTDFWPGLLSPESHYGPFRTAASVLQDVTGVPLDQPIPLPRFEDQTPEIRLRLAKNILWRGPTMERYRFTKTELAAQRPFNQDYRELILEFIAKTKLSGQIYSPMIPYIAWLAAGDPGLAPIIAKMYVERAASDANGAAYARSLSYFGPDILAPYAAQLLGLYQREIPASQSPVAFRADLNFGIGGAGPEVVEKLIGELRSPTTLISAAAAASLCRAADSRATEPLLEKIRSIDDYDRNAISYAYALARLGRGKDAQEAIKRGTPQSARACLDEIVEKYPSGNAPDSVCLLSGPHAQAPDTAWQFSNSQLRCLAPRTPSPNG
jgi:hypothetical protein